MGCGSSKTDEQPPPVRPKTAVRPETRARPKTAAPPKTALRPESRSRPETRSRPKTGAPPKTGTRPETGTRSKPYARPGSSQKHNSTRPPSSYQKSAYPPSSRPRTSNRAAEKPEDAAISGTVENLAAIIEGHARHYYSGNKFEVSKEIGQSIVNFAIMSDDYDEENITAQILGKLQRYGPKDSPKREPHLQGLVEEGRNIRDMMQRHRGTWGFDDWEDGIRFPSLLKNGVPVTSPRD